MNSIFSTPIKTIISRPNFSTSAKIVTNFTSLSKPTSSIHIFWGGINSGNNCDAKCALKFNLIGFLGPSEAK
ncbi:MAG: hypothetical protein ABF301_05270 [Sulfurovum sp.]|nr:MAG: Uncharacterised protein [Arcobacter lacus]